MRCGLTLPACPPATPESGSTSSRVDPGAGSQNSAFGLPPPGAHGACGAHRAVDGRVSSSESSEASLLRSSSAYTAESMPSESPAPSSPANASLASAPRRVRARRAGIIRTRAGRPQQIAPIPCAAQQRAPNDMAPRHGCRGHAFAGQHAASHSRTTCCQGRAPRHGRGLCCVSPRRLLPCHVLPPTMAGLPVLRSVHHAARLLAISRHPASVMVY